MMSAESLIVAWMFTGKVPDIAIGTAANKAAPARAENRPQEER